MPIYQYQGRNYDIDTQDPAAARQRIQAYLTRESPTPVQAFGQSTAALADTALNAVTGTLDYLAYPLARAYYGQTLPPEAAAQRAAAETTSPKNMIGQALGIQDYPQYRGEATQRATQAIGEAVAPAVTAVSQATGLPETDIASMAGTAALPLAAPAARVSGAALRGADAAVTAAVQAAQVPGRVVKGAVNQLSGRPSARATLGETYVDPAVMQAYRQGRITLPELETQGVRPTAELATNTLERIALQSTGGRVPYRGQAPEALGESLVESYTGPRGMQRLAVDLALPALGVPIAPYAIKRGAEALSQNILGRKGFDPGVPAEIQAARGAEGVRIMQQAAPTTAALPYTPGVRARSFERREIPPMSVPEGPVGQGSYPDLTAQTQAAQLQRQAREAVLAEIRARGVPGPVAPARTAQPPAPVAPETLPTPTLEQRAAAAFGDRYRAPGGGLDDLRTRLMQKRAAMTPEELAAEAAEVSQAQAASAARSAVRSENRARRDSIADVTKTAVRSQGGQVRVDKKAYAELDPESRINWSQQPDVTGQSVRDARQTINQFVDRQLRSTSRRSPPAGVSQYLPLPGGDPFNLFDRLAAQPGRRPGETVTRGELPASAEYPQGIRVEERQTVTNNPARDQTTTRQERTYENPATGESWRVSSDDRGPEVEITYRNNLDYELVRVQNYNNEPGVDMYQITHEQPRGTGREIRAATRIYDARGRVTTDTGWDRIPLPDDITPDQAIQLINRIVEDLPKNPSE